jgi:glutamate/tyrosine decarboxylase-like PLP-dependent enzyme
MVSQAEEKFLNDVFLTLSSYLKTASTSEKVIKRVPAEKLKNALPQLTAKGISHSELLTELTYILEHSVRTVHPLFLNQLFGGFDAAAWVGEVVSTLLNPTMATFEVAPLLTVIEKKLVSELLALFGIERGEGIMVTGGSNANLLAMLCARTDYNPSIRQTGFAHNRFRIYVSEEAHYSFDKAANITGIGTQNLILIPANDQGEMIPEDLERIIISDIKDGYVPLMVGATVGTTVLGAFDPLLPIARICEAHKIWFHVDAAWGGGAIFSESFKDRLQGISLADSLTFDAHKTLGTNLITSFFLTKHPGILKTTNRGGGAEYLFHEYDNSEWDTGTYSLQCGRKADALKLWLLWRLYGTEGITKRTEHLLRLAEFATKEIDEHPRFKLIHAHYLNVCFQIVPKHNRENINDLTLKVRQELIQQGQAMVNYAQRADGTIFFRLVFPNHQTKLEHINELLKIIAEVADRVELLGA